ncbi:phage tail assembly protein T, partial [Kitasatospora sp. NPDC001574]
LDRISSAELTDWIAYERITGPIGPERGDVLHEPLEHALRGLTVMRPALAPSLLGDEAVLLGAVATALDIARPEVFERRSAPVD